MVKSGENIGRQSFIGLYERNLEARGRLAIPKKFRQGLERLAVLTRGLDGCLFLFPSSIWAEISHKLRETPLTSQDARAFTRLLTYEAFEVEFDSQGRILIPEVLKKFAGLVKEAIIAGSLDRVEIWAKEKFIDYQGKIEKTSDEIAERLTNLEIRI
jgi:MraZ protein